MKELKAGQWIKCIKTYKLEGDDADGVENYPTEITKGKWYFIIDSRYVIKFNLNNFGWSSLVLDKNVFQKHFDTLNPLDYNPDELEEARLKRKAAYEASTQKKDKLKFKVGDKVKVISDTSFSELRKLKIGSIGKIVEIADAKRSVQWVNVEFEDKEVNQYLMSEIDAVTEQSITPSKFKVGDDVRVVSATTSSNGLIGWVDKVLTDGKKVIYEVWLKEKRSRIFFREDQLRMLEETDAKFKVGDKVKVISDTSFAEVRRLRIGSVGNVTHVGYGTRWYITVRFTDNVEYGYFLEELELVVEEHEEITPDNIAEVLEYNGIKKWIWYPDGINIDYKINIQFSNPKWLQHLELEVGKLKPLPKKKEPTFENALIELGFEFKDDTDASRENTYIRKYVNVVNWARIARANQRWDESSELIYTTKEQLAKDIAAFEEKHKFRPHWSLVDDGGHGKEIGRIYRDEIKEKVNSGLLVVGAVLRTLFMNYEHSQPYQYINKESDFVILFKDGSLVKAFWRGEE